MNKPQDNQDTTKLNIATYNDPYIIEGTMADTETYLPPIVETELFKEFNNSLPGRSILDLGCGPGLVSKYYSDNGYDVTGLDFSEGMIKVAKKTCPNCKFIVKNALDLVPEDGQFDGIVAFHLVQFFDRQQIVELLNKIASVLTKDGKFLMIFTNTCHPKSGINEIEGTDLQEYWNRWQLEDIAPAFKKSNLDLIKFEQLPRFENGDEPFFFIAQKGK